MQAISRRKLAAYAADQLHAGEKPRKLAQQLAAYLIESKQVHNVDLLVSDIESALSVRHNISTVRIVSAHDLTAALQKTLTDFVRKTENAKEVIIADETTNPDLIGGATVSTPNGFFDGSVRYQLQQLKVRGE